MRPIFYHGTTKSLIVAFATIFDELKIYDGAGFEIAVPITYSPREKFIEITTANPDIDNPNMQLVLPRMGFEIVGMNYAPERNLNPTQQIHNAQRAGYADAFMYNRVPWDFSLELNIAARRFEDSLKIVEQIIPFFSPEMTLTLKDQQAFDMENNIQIVLNSVGFTIDYEGTFDTRRSIIWTLGFTMKAYMYCNIVETQRIKKAITELTQFDFDELFEKYTAEVVPRSANKYDEHEIVEKTETNE